ncbi:hypothetical protein VaNZ11_005328 [Volvox africanus]|uniref:ubiquitinyl hydrolase 1 n=1 Tax=Volvox africanus TaxID=51714 RepID=A0ABQ5RYE2_9CHLO|nr:hypothetical protein VaNZ11_005328 [Volvox africanus]
MTVAVHSEAAEVDALEKNASWTVGSIGYLVSTAWWNIWVQYSSYTGPGAASAASLLRLPGGSGPRPGPISNADLLPPGYSASKPQLPGATTPQGQTAPNPEEVPLRPGLVEQRDFVAVSADTWKHLYSTYGGGPAIARRIVTEAAPGTSGGTDAAERWRRLTLYPLQLEVLYKARDGSERSTVISIDPEASLSALKARACSVLCVSESEVALWDYTGGRPVRYLEAMPPSEAGTITTSTGGAVPRSVEDGTPAPPASSDGTANGAGRGGGMDVDSAAMTTRGPAAIESQTAAQGKVYAKDGVMGQQLREVPLMNGHLLGLRRRDAGVVSFDAGGEDACGSDNDNDTGQAARRKEAGKKTAVPVRMSIAEEAATTGVRRASAAGSSRSDGGSGTGVPIPPAPARTGGRPTGLTFGSNRQGNQRSSWGASEDNVIPRDGQPPGLAGLSNLGNTCFMNSSLQCLTHAVPLMRAFLGGAYLQDLNRTNPLGMKGELAEAFGSLMEQLWRGGLSAVTPRSFKAKIGRFAPQFSGYAQHDSQEFLAFLLDGLHEDTNRIRNKPYIEERDQPGRPDEEVAAEAWANYRARNDSLVVDHFQGLFKSTVDCPQCGFNSVKFDPFMYLSLPLPESRRRVVEVVLVRTDGSELPCRMALELSSGATLADLLRATAQVACLPAEVVSAPERHLLAARPLRGPSSTNDEVALLTDSRLRVADALDAGGSGSTYSLRSSSNSPDSGLVVYHYPDAARGPRAEGLAPVIVHFKRPDSRRTTSWSRGVWCGAPLVLYMPEDQPPYAPEQVIKVPSSPGNRSEWEISGDCPLAAALVEVLRPIQRLPLAMPPPPLPQGADSAVAHTDMQAATSAEGCSTKCLEEAEAVQAPMGQSAEDSVTVAEKGDGQEQLRLAEAVVPALVQMEEDDRLVIIAGADEELRPGTPTWDGARGGAGASDGSNETPIHRCSSNGKVIVTADLMEGMESLPAPAVETIAVSSTSGLAGGGYVGSSLQGTPEPSACGAMEDDVAMANPAPLPAVIILGPPESADAADATGLRPPGVEPFDMWVGQSTWGADDGGAAAGAAAAGQRDAGATAPTVGAPFTGPPFSLKLCNSKGESMLWGVIYDKDIKVEHHREFLLMFSDATSGADGAPYAAELLDGPSEHPSLGQHMRRVASGPQPVSLDACMTTFLQPERLAESDAWYCPRCKSHVCADKKLDLWSLPEVLVVHLKRFSYTRYSRNKLDTRVDFPLHGLDLGPYVMRPQAVSPMYDLFAVSNHYGSLGGGHYTAYAKLPSPFSGSMVDVHGAAAEAQSVERWYCFDDSHVSLVAPEAVRSPAAYVLFYRRRAEAAKDPPDVEDLLELLKQQRVELQHQMASTAGLPADGPTENTAGAGPGGSPDSGSDRQPEHDQDPDQGSRGAFLGSRRSGALGAVGEVSIAAAAAAAQAARGSEEAVPTPGDGEELVVEGRSMAAFSLGSRDPAVAGTYPHGRIGGSGGGGGFGVSSDSYGDAAAAEEPARITPMSVGNTYGDTAGVGTTGGRSTNLSSGERHYGEYGGNGAYDTNDFSVFALDDGGAGDSLADHCEGALIQPPGSPVEFELDRNNADVSELYQEVEDMEVLQDRLSGSDMASAGGNDQEVDPDDDVTGLGDDEGVV